MKDLAHNLLSTDDNRISDPQKALVYLQKPSWSWRRGVVVGALVLVTILALSVYSRHRSVEASELDGKVRELEKKNQDKDQVIADLTKKIEQRPRNPSPPELPPSSDSQKEWNERVVKSVDRTAVDYVDQILNRAKDLSHNNVSPEFLKWRRAVDERRAKFAGWEQSDPRNKLPELLRNVATSPWDVKQFDDRMATLESAARSWRAWVNDPGQTPSSVKEAIAGKFPEEREILEGWHSAFFNKTSWQFCLKGQRVDRGTYGDNLGGGRVVTVYHNSTELPIYDAVLPDAYTHDFNEKDDAKTIEWTPGENLEVYLERSWRVITGGVKSNLAVGKFNGPFALQQLNWKGEINGEGAKLTFRILDCPGPPPPLSVQNVIAP